MRRFFVPADRWGEDPMELPLEEARHARRVLRLRPGNRVVVFDGDGHEVEAIIVRLDRSGGWLSPCGPVVTREEPIRFVVGVGLPKGGKLDTVIRHATELGAAEIHPLLCARTVPDPEDARGRVTRWRRIAREATKQSRRARVPLVAAPESLDTFLTRFAACSEPKQALVADEEAPSTSRLQDVEPVSLEPGTWCWLLVGPEGGLERTEVSAARAAGFTPVSLGPRILRVETAALALLAVAQHRWGDL